MPLKPEPLGSKMPEFGSQRPVERRSPEDVIKERGKDEVSNGYYRSVTG